MRRNTPRMLEVLASILRTDLTPPPLPFWVTRCPCTAIVHWQTTDCIQQAAEPPSPLPPSGATGGDRRGAPTKESARNRAGGRPEGSPQFTSSIRHTTHYCVTNCQVLHNVYVVCKRFTVTLGFIIAVTLELLSHWNAWAFPMCCLQAEFCSTTMSGV